MIDFEHNIDIDIYLIDVDKLKEVSQIQEYAYCRCLTHSQIAKVSLVHPKTPSVTIRSV